MASWKSVMIAPNDEPHLCFHYYTELDVSIHDKVLYETKAGTCLGSIIEVNQIPCNPFEKNPCGYHAKAHILQNLTTGEVNKIYKEKLEELEMFENVAYVKYIGTERNLTVVCISPINVKPGDIVMYSDDKRDITKISLSLNAPFVSACMHVGIITQIKPVAACNDINKNAMIIGKVDTEPFITLQRTLREKEIIKKELNKKAAAFKEYEMYALMAKSDPEVAELLDRLKQL